MNGGRRAHRKGALGKKVTFSAVFMVAALGTVEGGFRLHQDQVRRQSVHEDDALCGYRLKPNLSKVPGDDGVRGRPVTNALGHRGRELAPQKSTSTLRIACLGGSTTFGYGATSEEATYPAVLERLLAGAVPPGRQVEVFNAGVAGWSSRTSLDNLSSRLRTLEFDLVIIKHANNDLYESWSQGYAERSLRAPGELPAQGWVETAFRRSASLGWLGRKAQLRALKRKREAYSPEGRAAFDRNLRALLRLVRELDGRPILCTYPHVFPPQVEEAARMRFKGHSLLKGTMRRSPLSYEGLAAGLQAYNEQIRETARAERAELIDLEALVPPIPALYVDYIHQDDAGLQVLAGRVAQRVVQSGWLDDQR